MLLVIDVVVKGSLVLAAAMLGAVLLRRASASARCVMWSASVVALLLLPVLGAVVPAWTPPLVPEVPHGWAPERSLATNAALRTSKVQGEVGEIALLPRPTPRAPALATPSSLVGVERATAASRSFAPGEPGAASGRKQSAGRREPPGRPLRSGARRVATVPSTPPGVATRQQRSTTTEAPASKADPQSSPSLQRATPTADAVPTWLVLLAGLYFLGGAVLLARLLAGVAAVLRMTRAARPVPDGPLRRDFARAVTDLGIERDVRLLETGATPVPLAWELWRPAVLMPLGARAWPAGRRRTALLHELAHVQRRDCQMQLVAQLALALHCLNPLAWCAVRRLRVEREHACDDAVLRLGTRASEYADHLLQIARGLAPRREPAWASVAMARSQKLEGRVARILDPDNPRSLPRRRTIMTALIATLAFLLPLAAVQPGVAAQTPITEPSPPAAEEHAVQHLSETAAHPSDIGDLLDVAGRLLELTSRFGAVHAGDLSNDLTEIAAELDRHAGPEASAGSSSHTAAEAPATAAPEGAAQQGEPSIDDLVQMRIHGVSTDFIRAARDAFGRPLTTRELVQMRIHGTTPEFVAGVQELFPDQEITVRDVTNLRIHGASIEYIRAMRDALGETLGVRDITNLRIHGATPEFARAMRELLDEQDIDARDITQMRVHGASADFVREMSELLDDQELDARDITQMRIHGVTTELVRDLQEDGFENLTVDDLVRMKIHGFDRWLQRRRGGENRR